MINNNSGVPMSMSQIEMQEALIGLYLSVKVRPNEELEKFDEAQHEREVQRLRKLDPYALIEYIKSSIEILITLKNESLERSKQFSTEKFSHSKQDSGMNETFSDFNGMPIGIGDEGGRSGNGSIGLGHGMGSNGKSKQMGQINDDYEQMIQKLEGDVRNHIRIEQQLKLHIESIQNKLEDAERTAQAISLQQNNAHHNPSSSAQCKKHHDQIELLKREKRRMDELITLKESQMDRYISSLEIADTKIANLEQQIGQNHNLEEKYKQLERKYKTDIAKLQNDLQVCKKHIQKLEQAAMASIQTTQQNQQPQSQQQSHVSSQQENTKNPFSSTTTTCSTNSNQQIEKQTIPTNHQQQPQNRQANQRNSNAHLGATNGGGNVGMLPSQMNQSEYQKLYEEFTRTKQGAPNNMNGQAMTHRERTSSLYEGSRPSNNDGDGGRITNSKVIMTKQFFETMGNSSQQNQQPHTQLSNSKSQHFDKIQMNKTQDPQIIQAIASTAGGAHFNSSNNDNEQCSSQRQKIYQPVPPTMAQKSASFASLGAASKGDINKSQSKTNDLTRLKDKLNTLQGEIKQQHLHGNNGAGPQQANKRRSSRNIENKENIDYQSLETESTQRLLNHRQPTNGLSNYYLDSARMTKEKRTVSDNSRPLNDQQRINGSHQDNQQPPQMLKILRDKTNISSQNYPQHNQQHHNLNVQGTGNSTGGSAFTLKKSHVILAAGGNNNNQLATDRPQSTNSCYTAADEQTTIAGTSRRGNYAAGQLPNQSISSYKIIKKKPNNSQASGNQQLNQTANISGNNRGGEGINHSNQIPHNTTSLSFMN